MALRVHSRIRCRLSFLPLIVLVICVLLVTFPKPCVAQEASKVNRFRSLYDNVAAKTSRARSQISRSQLIRRVGAIMPAGEKPVQHAGSQDAKAAHPADGHPKGAGHEDHSHDDHSHDDDAHHEHGDHSDEHGSHGDEHGGHHEHISVPPMLGSVSRGAGNRAVRFPIRRLIVNPTQFAIPALGAGTLSLTQSGPVNILDSTGARSAAIQQRFHRIGTLPSPPANIVGTIGDTGVLNTTQTVAEINTAFMATLQPYDLISVSSPPASYNAAVDGVFRAGTTVNGQTVYDPTSSGALRSFGTETVQPVNGVLAAGDTLDAFYAFDFVTTLAVPSPSGDGLIGRTSVASNTTAIPTNRLYFDYSLVNNAVPTNRLESFDRFTVGFERAINVIFEGHLSVEARLPFAASLDHRIAVESGMGPSQVEMGNALLIVKHMIAESDNFVLSGGLGLQLPTGSDVEIESLDGTKFLRYDNETTHLKPFLGFAYVPDEHFFMQGFFEYDTPAGTNQVMLNLDGGGLQTVGRLRDSSHLLFDVSAGYWIDAPGDNRFVRRWAPTLEMHFDRGMGDTSVLTGNSYRLLDISDSRELLNLIVGATIDLDNNRYLSLGYVTGIGGDGSDSDGELRVALNFPFDAK